MMEDSLLTIFMISMIIWFLLSTKYNLTDSGMAGEPTNEKLDPLSVKKVISKEDEKEESHYTLLRFRKVLSDITSREAGKLLKAGADAKIDSKSE